MRSYELIMIVDPEIGEDDINAVINKVSEFITQLHGKVVKVEKWGKRKLAYKIKKNTKGYYVIFYFTALPSVIKEIDRTLHYNEKILRHQIILAGILTSGVDKGVSSEEKVISQEDKILTSKQMV